MRASWIDGAVAEFGRHFGFEHFALNDRDVAAARFENGVRRFQERQDASESEIRRRLIDEFLRLDRRNARVERRR